MTIEIRDPSLEARIRKQLQDHRLQQRRGSVAPLAGSHLRLCHPERSDCFANAKQPRSRRIPTRVQCADPAGSFRQCSRLSRRALPETASAVPACKGSFDCVVARFATDNSAQDDRAVRADEYHAKQNAPDSFESWDVCRSALPQVLLNHKTKRKPHIGKWLVRAITRTKVTTHGSSGTSGHSVDLPRIRPVLVDMFTT